ncbi:synaptopodin 2-like protein isoform X2 [Latimeria chalumnae]|uniref:synaptopodin 2-like protein isoform X2 n=1 Tax=Latimeria chalumnae TaxID=7897 RepID=UPI0003C13F4D|nr:PREDICTED: synaptopodin 2-like protein isoform X2 [Latimeria chalumnae]|eukprot:XP_006004986.1 PREDICTED: synaptopodin 2-like protein isoform X2 [Latimeria chalumnae]
MFSNIRKRSKAWRAGMRENDEFMSINRSPCAGLSHAEAMQMMDSSTGIVQIQVKRASAGNESGVTFAGCFSPTFENISSAPLRVLSPSKLNQQEFEIRHFAASPIGAVIRSPEPLSEGKYRLKVETLASPSDSEAYYGETDSDADTVHEKQRRTKRRSPRSSPGQSHKAYNKKSTEEVSEMSGYDSAPEPPHYVRPEAQVPLHSGSDSKPYQMIGPGKPAHSVPGYQLHKEKTQALSAFTQIREGKGSLVDLSPHLGVAKREIMYQPQRMEAQLNIWQPKLATASLPDNFSLSDQNMKDTPGISEKDSGFQEEPIPRSSPKIVLLVNKNILPGKHLIPMVGPVDNPVDEELTMTYKEKAKQAKLHRSESVQEKQVKEARTKCKTIASLLTDAPNPHSKGVLMFKKRRQRAKKYTLVSYGSVDEDRYNEEEDGVFPTSESEFDEEGFSDARSLTNHSAHSDWDNTYLDIEKPKDVPQQEQGLNEASGKGAALFEQQRRRSGEYVVEEVPAQKEKTQQGEQNSKSDAQLMQNVVSVGSPSFGVSSPSVSKAYSEVVNPTTMNVNSDFIPSVAIQHQPPEPCGESTMFSTGVVNRTARPFTPGFVGSRTVTTPVIFRPCVPKAHTETPNVQNTVAKPFSPTTPVAPKPVFSSISQPVNLESKQLKSSAGPVNSTSTLYIPLPERPKVAAVSQQTTGEKAPEVKKVVSVFSPPATPAVTTTASIYLSPPSRSTEESTSPQPLIAVKSPESRQMTQIFSPPVTPVTPTALTHTSSLPEQSSSTVNFPVHPVTSPISPINQPSETLVSREQRIAVPAARTGILHEARRRGSKKQMFTVAEQKKNSPNPELLSLVQNLDEKPKQDHYGAGCESGPEEDFLSLGAEACNFLPSQAHKQKTPPPVAPKPQLRLLNGNPAPDISHLKGKGAELFAKRQSRMDKFIVDAVPVQADKPRCPSPAPSLPASWKYSPNIRAPPPIAYNPIYSPSYPPGAVKSQASKTSTGVKKVSSQKKGITAIDFMRRQPYQLNPAMFCFSGSANQSLPTTASNQATKQKTSSFLSARQVPLKAARVYEVKRFSTPVPMSTPTTLTPTVITPRSATTLAEPVWRTEICSPPPAFTPPAPMPKPVVDQSTLQGAKQYKSAPDLSPCNVLSSSGPHSLPQEPTVQAPKQTVGSLHVPRPRFSAANIGMQANVWRPASVK